MCCSLSFRSLSTRYGESCYPEIVMATTSVPDWPPYGGSALASKGHPSEKADQYRYAHQVREDILKKQISATAKQLAFCRSAKYKKSTVFSNWLLIMWPYKYLFFLVIMGLGMWSIMAERLRALDSCSDVSDQLSVGSSPGLGTCFLEQDAFCLSFEWDNKP